jgi:outer membrane protein assembly factor BamB
MPAKPRSPVLVGLILVVGLAALSLLTFAVLRRSDDTPGTTAAGSSTTLPTTTGSTAPTTSVPDGSTTTAPTTSTASTTTTTTTPMDPWVDRRTVGKPWGDAVSGLLTFRGNPTNTFYGTGPIPETPEITWRYPDAPMCAVATDLGGSATWCGNGWTGQPVIWERPDGVAELMFGGYDRKFHFVNAATGEDTRQPILTGDSVKGSPTIDPDGYPLVYFGSRDNLLRIVALDRGEAEVLWTFEAEEGSGWNDDWDPAPRIVNDILFEGCENSIFYAWKLNRSYGADGKVTVDPELLVRVESWDDALMAALSPSQWIGARWASTSIESSSAIFEGTLYFGTSGGRIMGLDITNVERGVAPVVFDYWVADDSDASIVIDEEGMLYVSSEVKRYLPRGREVGQLVKLDPSQPDDPYVWGVFALTDSPYWGGYLATPALGDGVLYTVSNKGYLAAVDRDTGEEVWLEDIGVGQYSHGVHMSSPVVVDGHQLVAVATGTLRSYDLSDPRRPVLEWELPVGTGSLEATPAVWKGTIYLASSSYWGGDAPAGAEGYLYAIGE